MRRFVRGICCLRTVLLRAVTSEDDLSLVLSAIEERIKARRLELKEDKEPWSQEEIADRAEVDRKEFGKIENADAEPRITTVLKIAGALGIPLEQLIEDLVWIPGESNGFGHMERRKK
jgi:transcriptional regulator with XRE-family HTH domain